MALYTDLVQDSYQRPIPGVEVLVLTSAGALAALMTQGGSPVANPVTTDAAGRFSFYAADGVYGAEFRYGGVTIREDDITVGNPPQYIGPAGPAANGRVNLAALKAAATTDLFSSYDGSLWSWETANAPYTADDVNVVKANSTALSVGAWVRQPADKVPYKRASAPAILTVTKALDALGVHPLLWGWDGLPTSDASDYVEDAAEYCTAGTDYVGAYGRTTISNLPLAQTLFIPGHARITRPIPIKQRAVDRTNSLFTISGVPGTGGVLQQDGNFVLFTSDLADPTPTPYPMAGNLRFDRLRFINRNLSNTGSTVSSKFLRVWLDHCEWHGMTCLASADRYAQEWHFTNCIVRLAPAGRAFFKAKGAYIIRATGSKLQFSDTGSKGGFDLLAEDGSSGVVGCSFSECSYESNDGPFLRAGICQGVSVDRLYTEGNTGPILDFRCLTGSVNSGVIVDANEFNASTPNQADSSFYNVLVGPGGLSGRGNSSKGGLYDNSPRTGTVNGLAMSTGCGVGELESGADRPAAGFKKYSLELDAQVALVPDVLSGYATKISARSAQINPVNNVEAHTIALPPPKKDMRVFIAKALANPCTILPSWSADGAKFRGGSTNAGVVFGASDISRQFVCNEDGIWDG